MFASRVTTALVAALLLAGASTCPAQIPQKMNYQVMLTDDADQPLADQSVVMVFTIFDAESGGTALWTETQNPTTNSIGVVSVILGSVTLVDIPFDAPRWLEVEVDGETLTPRREIVTAPYAGRAATADDSDRLGDIDASEYALLTDLVGTGDGHSLDADDGAPVDALYVDANGDVGIGTTSPQAELHVRQEIQVGSTATLGTLTVHGGSAANGAIRLEGDGVDGGSIFIDDGMGDTYVTLGPTNSPGGGGRLNLAKDNEEHLGILLDGNYNDDEEPGLLMIGSTRSLQLYMGGGNSDYSVSLPDDSINASEILDEPGVASIQANNSVDLTPGAIQTVAARTVVVPSSGYVFVMGNAQVEIYDYGSSNSRIWFGISESSTAWSGAAQEMKIELPGVMPGGWDHFHAAVHGVFEVSAGQHTFYMLAREESGECNVQARQFSILFFPTAYGLVDVTD